MAADELVGKVTPVILFLHQSVLDSYGAMVSPQPVIGTLLWDHQEVFYWIKEVFGLLAWAELAVPPGPQQEQSPSESQDVGPSSGQLPRSSDPSTSSSQAAGEGLSEV